MIQFIWYQNKTLNLGYIPLSFSFELFYRCHNLKPSYDKNNNNNNNNNNNKRKEEEDCL